MCIRTLHCFLTLFATGFFFEPASAQFQYISPVPGSGMHHPETNIILRNGSLIEPSTLRPHFFSVTGSTSGHHTVSITLSDDGKTILLQPEVYFNAGETVTVAVHNGLRTAAGKNINGTSFTFETIAPITHENQKLLDDARRQVFEEEFGTAKENSESDTRDLSEWTGGLPPLSIWVNNNPAPGDIFFHNFNFSDQPTEHYCIMKNNGDSVYGKFIQDKGIGFTINKNGYMTMYNEKLSRFEMLDSNYKMNGKFYCGNGYQADVHDFLVLPNGHSYLIAYDYQFFDMTVYDPSYNPDAIVIGAIVQELDAAKNVVFQWRSWDHFEVTDAVHIPLTTLYIDYVHANSIELEDDGSFLLSSRHMDEVTKISFATGEIIWRLGGAHNEFTFVGDQKKFCYQHDARRLPNGNITIFDNGNYHFPALSAAKEYSLDEVNKVATLVWSYERNLPGSSSAMGSAQRLPNGNTFICWGLVYNPAFPSITEVDQQGNVVWEMRLDAEFNDGIYRAHRLVWTPCARPSKSTLETINITPASAKLKWQKSTNANSYEVQYRVSSTSNWISKAVSGKVVTLNNLTPNTSYDWKVRAICSAPNPPQSGFSAIKTFTTLPLKFEAEAIADDMEIYPNPAANNVTIGLNLEQEGNLLIRVMNMMGQEQLVKQLTATQGENTISLLVNDWPKGIYFVEAIMPDVRKVGKVTVE